MKICVLCEEMISGYGHNPTPLADSGLCCDNCNWEVIRERLRENVYIVVLDNWFGRSEVVKVCRALQDAKDYIKDKMEKYGHEVQLRIIKSI